jgi:hypothetical protein
MRIKRDWRKKNNARFAYQVCGLHRNFKRGIVERPLRALHPVNHALTVRVGRAWPSDCNTSVRG